MSSCREYNVERSLSPDRCISSERSCARKRLSLNVNQFLRAHLTWERHFGRNPIDPRKIQPILNTFRRDLACNVWKTFITATWFSDLISRYLNVSTLKSRKLKKIVTSIFETLKLERLIFLFFFFFWNFRFNVHTLSVPFWCFDPLRDQKT